MAYSFFPHWDEVLDTYFVELRHGSFVDGYGYSNSFLVLDASASLDVSSSLLMEEEYLNSLRKQVSKLEAVDYAFHNGKEDIPVDGEVVDHTFCSPLSEYFVLKV